MTPTRDHIDELDELILDLADEGVHLMPETVCIDTDRLKAKLERHITQQRIDELEKLAEQYGEFMDETLGKPIVLKAVTLYRIKRRISELENPPKDRALQTTSEEKCSKDHEDLRQNLNDICGNCGKSLRVTTSEAE